MITFATKILLVFKNEVSIHYHRRKYRFINPQLVQPDLLVYLHAPISKLKENIKKRNRSYEQSIDPEYLFSLQEMYTQYIKQHNIKTLFIDVTNADFVQNPDQFKQILNALEKEYDEGQHYLLLT